MDRRAWAADSEKSEAAPAVASRRLKVVLYNPRAVFYQMPLALLAIGSHLDPDRYEVVTIDGRLEADPVGAVLSHLEDAVCLGVTVLTGAPILDAMEISRAAKRAHSDMPVVWGGWHPSMFARECLAEPSVDVTVQAQGEETFADILERLLEGRSLEGCAGCAFRRDDGSICINPPRDLKGVSTFREPDYGLIPVERYFELKGKRQLDYISSQGCNFRCAFCSDPFVYGRKWVGLDPVSMGVRLKALWDRYRFDDINFQDETFFTRRDRVKAFAEEVIASGMEITWAATMRADQGVRLPDDVWQLCKQSGLRRLLVGVESGSSEMLKRIRKDVTIDQVFETAGKMLAHGIAGHFPFIVGFPDESDESIQDTLACARRLRSMSPDFLTPIFYFKPYPGSEIVTEAVARGYKLPETLEEWAGFDYVQGEPGPWVSPEKFRLIERFKFFHELAWKRAAPAERWLQRLARYRCSRNAYRWPIEMALMRAWRSEPRLS
ncbi:B12-binding domain-containing radical SAM protein [Sphingomonas sp. JC676]|uniref:B12-binding domain-containing radical SAM protein n=1 Tax=Sphingomonas sp. JC676 TaxID=2768065 RepID=UPI0016582321|nr:radical SAM protein [Sphingomonas sp. JC676]MBC9032481.1 B12-binding domain-containing radical SAM protein [Sphingomonas sp. JC676]